ncbi:tyrosine-type recombinase/integrase [Bacteroidota bacterium]
MKIETLVISYLDYLKSIKRYSSHTLKAYKTDLNQFLDYSTSNKKINIRDLTENIIKSYLMNLSDSSITKRSISRKLSAVRGMIKYAFANSISESNVSAYIKNPRSDRKLPGITTIDSILTIYDLADEADKNPARVKIIFELLYGCALRVAELCSLNIGDIDLRRKMIKVKGKGSKVRIVPVGSKSIQIVGEYQNQYSSENRNNPLIITDRGNRIYPKYVYRIVNKYLSKVTDIKKKSPHILRHSAATHMLDAGADLRAVKEILGHENLSTTQIYTHVSIERLKSTYKKSHPKS